MMDLESERRFLGAVQAGDAALVEQMLGQGADPDTLGPPPRYRSALVMAAAAGHRSVAERLAAAGADVDAFSPDNGYSALEEAALAGQAAIVAWLLEKGATRIEPALLAARMGGQESIVRLLQSHLERLK